MCDGDKRFGGVRIFQVWIGVKIRILSWYHFFQLSKKLLEVRLLGRGGGDFWGHANVMNKKVGCQNSRFELGWEQM